MPGPVDAPNPVAVLVVEDEALLRVVAVETLREEGFTVLEAGDGAEALDTLKTHPEIRLIITDVKMPRLGGYELVEQALGFRPDLKIVLMTGYAQSPPATFDTRIPILHKPFELSRLSAMAKTILDAV